jgi:hypothetical protein
MVTLTFAWFSQRKDNMNLQLPFASKELPNGKTLHIRNHGYSFTLAANTETYYSVTVPYNHAKINEAEVHWAPEGVFADMKIKDDTSGTYSGVANAVLEQYGDNVCVREGFFQETSPYDADIYLGMVLEFRFNNTSAVEKIIGINIKFHEVL